MHSQSPFALAPSRGCRLAALALGVAAVLPAALVVSPAGATPSIDGSWTQAAGGNPSTVTTTNRGSTGIKRQRYRSIRHTAIASQSRSDGGPISCGPAVLSPDPSNTVECEFSTALPPGASVTVAINASPAPDSTKPLTVSASESASGEDFADFSISPATSAPGPTPTPTTPTPGTQPNELPQCKGVKSAASGLAYSAKRKQKKLKPGQGAPPKAPKSALQGQCTLPPKGACPAKAGSSINGGAGDDNLVGTSLADQMHGQGGNDTVRGGGDNDVIQGGPGSDQLFGEDCNDVLFGASGAGVDQAWEGGPGDDLLNGQAFSMSGGPGDDGIYNGAPRSTSEGGAGDDRILANGDGKNTVNGGAGNDVVSAVNSAEDNVNGGPGRDLCIVDRNRRGPGSLDNVRGCEEVRHQG